MDQMNSNPHLIYKVENLGQNMTAFPGIDRCLIKCSSLKKKLYVLVYNLNTVNCYWN